MLGDQLQKENLVNVARANLECKLRRRCLKKEESICPLKFEHHYFDLFIVKQGVTSGTWGRITPGTSAYTGGWWSGRSLLRKEGAWWTSNWIWGSTTPSWQRCLTALGSNSIRLHYEEHCQQVKEDDPSPLLSTGEATSGLWSSVCSFPVRGKCGQIGKIPEKGHKDD